MTRILKVDPLSPDERAIDEAVTFLRKGAILAYPTETFYGLGVDVTNEQAISHLFDVKRRDYGNPVAVIVADEEMLLSIVEEIPEKARPLMQAFWPGPLTILFRTNPRISRRLTTNTGKIGIRISSHPVAMALVRRLGRPLTTTSANLSGFPPSFDLRHLKNYFGEKLDVIIDGGELPPASGSTVVDVTEEKLSLIREGAIRADVLFRYFEEEEAPLLTPFRGLRFHPGKIPDLSRVVAPPYDVISPKLQEDLYARETHNVVRLILGRQDPADNDQDNRYTRAAADFRRWREEGVLVQDPEPSFYLYEQSFRIEGRTLSRRGFLALRRLEEFRGGKIRPHEQTLAAPKEDRLLLMKACGANFSPIFSLYSDPEGRLPRRLAPYFDLPPLSDFEDDEGVRHRFWRVVDDSLFREANEILGMKEVFIADGHHRYETAMAYREWMRAQNPQAPEEAPFHFVMMFFGEISDPGLVVLPTHRILQNWPGFDRERFRRDLAGSFELKTFPPSRREAFFAERERWGKGGLAIGVLLAGERDLLLAVLKGPPSPPLPPSPEDRLDAMVLHRKVLRGFLGLSEADEKNPRFLRFVKDETEALEAWEKGSANAVFLLNPPSLGVLKEVFEAGRPLPPKTTYFYPKLLTGLVINKLGE